MRIHRIALATDFSACAREAYGPTADLAARMGARIELVHWVEYPSQYSPVGISELWTESYRDAARGRLVRESMDPLFKNVTVGHHLLVGFGPDSLQLFVDTVEVDLIAQGSHGYTGFRHVLLGSFAGRMVRTSTVPVLTFNVGAGHGGKGTFFPRKILVPHDFSPCAASALDAVRTFAQAYGATVVVINSWQPVPGYTDFLALGSETLRSQLAALYRDMPERLEVDLAEFATRELAGLDHEEHVVQGEPAEAITSLAVTRGADLICMATHGWTGFQRHLFGSVTDKVVRTAPCPTLTIRPRDPANPGGVQR